MKILSLIAAAAALFLSACDRHDWESTDGEMGTKELYEHHGDDHGGEGHGDAKEHKDGAADGHAEDKKEEAAH